jgi:hypothetical protein
MKDNDKWTNRNVKLDHTILRTGLWRTERKENFSANTYLLVSARKAKIFTV